VARWRILRRLFIASRETATAVILAAVCLHNLLVLNEENLPPHLRRYIPEGFVDREVGGGVQPGGWRAHAGDDVHAEMREDLQPEGDEVVPPVLEAEAIRESLVDYFLDQGAVDWQWDHLLYQ
jgi:hypothetical protein